MGAIGSSDIKNQLAGSIFNKLNVATASNASGDVSHKKAVVNVLGKKKAIPKFMTKKEREAFEA